MRTSAHGGPLPAADAPQHRRLRVLHLDHTTEPGGAELALARLIASPARDWDAELAVPVTPDGPGAFNAVAGIADAGLVFEGPRQSAGAATSSRAAAVGFGVALLQQARTLRRSTGLRWADVVHANSTRAAVYAGLALRGRRTPLVVHLRDLVTPESLGSVGYRAFRLFAERRADVFIANSETTAESVRPRLRPGQRMLVIPSPTGLTHATYAARVDPSDVLRVGMVARLDPWKGQELLLDAVATPALHHRVSLVLFGDAAFGKEAYRRRLERRAAELGIEVEFAGFVDDVAAAIDSLDVCVQYSMRPEPLGQNVLQYLARGRATIAAAEGGPTEWVEDRVNGMLIAPRDAGALANAIAELVADAPLRSRLAAAAVRTPGLLTDDEATTRHGEAFSGAVQARRRSRSRL